MISLIICLKCFVVEKCFSEKTILVQFVSVTLTY